MTVRLSELTSHLFVTELTSCIQVILNFFSLSKRNFDLHGMLWWTQVVVSCVFPQVVWCCWNGRLSRRGHLSSEGFFFVNNRSRALDLYLMELCAASVSRTARGFKNHNYRPSCLQPVVSFVTVSVCEFAGFLWFAFAFPP